jgi:hypothetical protein
VSQKLDFQMEITHADCDSAVAFPRKMGRHPASADVHRGGTESRRFSSPAAEAKGVFVNPRG